MTKHAQERTQRLLELLPHYPEDEHTNVIDLLTDILHWCQSSEVTFEAVLETARLHFDAESRGEEENGCGLTLGA